MKPERIQVFEVAQPEPSDEVALAESPKVGSEDDVAQLVLDFAGARRESVSVESLQVMTRYQVRLMARESLEWKRELLAVPEDAAEFFWELVKDEPREVMLAAFVDMRNRLIGWQEAFRGTLTRCSVEPRVMLQAALLVNAAGILLCHNHPMGDPAPSPEDLRFTQRMVEAAKLIGVQIVDHVIFGADGDWVSLKRRGGW